MNDILDQRQLDPRPSAWAGQSGPLVDSLNRRFRREIDFEILRAASELSSEVMAAAKPMIEGALHRRCRDAMAQSPVHWLPGIWMNGRRGMVLTAQDAPLLFAAVSKAEWSPAEPGHESQALIAIHCIKL